MTTSVFPASSKLTVVLALAAPLPAKVAVVSEVSQTMLIAAGMRIRMSSRVFTDGATPLSVTVIGLMGVGASATVKVWLAAEERLGMTMTMVLPARL